MIFVIGGYGVATGGPLAWGLCYNHEMSPSQDYCDPNYLYPCIDGVQYYGRGALPVYWYVKDMLLVCVWFNDGTWSLSSLLDSNKSKASESNHCLSGTTTMDLLVML